jgi:hypothetical protein
MEMRCAACGANQDHNLIRCEQCGKPLVFAASELKAAHERAEARRDPRQRALFPASDDAYRDDRFAERAYDIAASSIAARRLLLARMRDRRPVSRLQRP